MRDTNDKSFFNQSFYFKLANLRSPNIQSITTTGIFQCPMIRNFNYYHWMALDAMSRLQLTTANGCGEPGIDSSIRCMVLGGFTPGTPVSTPTENN